MGEQRVRLSQDGRLAAVSGAEGTPKLLKEPGDYRVFAGPNQSYLLLRHSEGAATRGRVLMVGELLNRMTVVEIINLVTSTSWNGELHVAGPEGTRVLTIAQGALKHARTEIVRERVGELLVRAGALEREQLEQLLQKKPAD